MAYSSAEKMELRRDELYEDLIDHTSRLLMSNGIPEDKAKELGNSLADFLVDHWGGQYITFSKDHLYRSRKRHLEIVGEFDGSNHHELARKHRVSVNTVYKILKSHHDQIKRSEA